MKVKELIRELKKHNPEMRVVTPRVEDYGDYGRMTEIVLDTEKLYEEDDPGEDDPHEVALIIGAKWDKDDEPEGHDFRQKYDLLWEAAKDLHDHLWKNAGHTADWPIAIRADSEEEAKKLAEKLQALRLLLNTEPANGGQPQ